MVAYKTKKENAADLVEIILEANERCRENGVDECSVCSGLEDDQKMECCPHFVAEVLADYGAVVLPCSIGQKVWAIRNYKGQNRPQEGIVSEMFFDEKMCLVVVVRCVARGRWGERVFKTCEDAEAYLRARK